MPCSIEELSKLFLFEKLDGDQLDRLCREGRVELFEPGYVYREGEAGHLLLRAPRRQPRDVAPGRR